jgi:hypothetical protein
VGSTGVGAPVSTADRDQVHLGVDDAASDGGGNLLGSLDAKTDVAGSVTDSDVALEAGALTGRCLLLDRHDLHDLVLKGRADKVIHYLVFLDRKGEKEDLLNRLDLSLLYKTAKFGDRDPLVLVVFISTSTSTSSSAVASSAITA